MMSVSAETIFTLACIIILVWRNEEKFTETTGRESDRAKLTDWSACKQLKTRKNTIRNQFEQQWFEVISIQKPRRVYPAI